MRGRCLLGRRGRVCRSASPGPAGHALPYEVVGRRAGDVAASYAGPARSNVELGWYVTRTIDDMCADSWRWQSKNPDGYPGPWHATPRHRADDSPFRLCLNPPFRPRSGHARRFQGKKRPTGWRESDQ
jgi:hypothetical protein